MSSIIPIPGGSSDASRPPSRTTTTPRTSTPTARRPSILKPTSDHRLNSNGNDDTSTKSLAKKRSHDSFAVEEDLLKPPIVVKVGTLFSPFPMSFSMYRFHTLPVTKLDYSRTLRISQSNLEAFNP